MRPTEMVCIINDLIDDFEKWLVDEKLNPGDKMKEQLRLAYSAASMGMLAKFQKLTGDNLFSDLKEKEEIPAGEAFEYYIGGAIARLSQQVAHDMIMKPQVDAIENYNDDSMKLVYTILESYSGKKLSGPDDDDGINGEEADLRHEVFNPLFACLCYVKNNKLNKHAVVNTLRGCADFFENLE